MKLSSNPRTCSLLAAMAQAVTSTTFRPASRRQNKKIKAVVNNLLLLQQSKKCEYAPALANSAV